MRSAAGAGLKRAGYALFLAGAACVAFYVLASMRGVSPGLVRAGGVGFYVGVAALVVGSVLRWLARR